MQVGANFGTIQTNYVRRDTKGGEKFENELGAESQNAQDKNTQDLGQIANLSQNAQSHEARRTEDVQTENSAQDSRALETLEGNANRITYGLRVIELMSDQEYQAFLWASEGMSEAEKIMMAQSLYRFTPFYQGKTQEAPSDMQTKNAQKAFGVAPSMVEDFIQRYKNAYEKVLYDSVLNQHLA